MKIDVDLARWQVGRNRLPPRTVSDQKRAVMKRYLDEMLKQDIISTSNAAEYSQILMVPKPKEKDEWRIVHDYRALNDATKSNVWPLPNILAMLTRIGAKHPRFFALMDMTKGYNQLPLSADSKVFTAFVTSSV